MQSNPAKFALCAVLVTMVVLLNGCGIHCEDGFFKDKNGHVVVASISIGLGFNSVTELTCKSQDLPDEDGYMRRYQGYSYNQGNPLECRQPDEGGSGKGWIFKATGKEAQGMTLPGECVKKKHLYAYQTCATCNKEKCLVLKEGVKGIPIKDAGGSCCTVDQVCLRKQHVQNGNEKGARETQRLYEETGWLLGLQQLLGLQLSAAGIAAVIGLIMAICRAHRTREVATFARYELATCEESNEEPEE